MNRFITYKKDKVNLQILDPLKVNKYYRGYGLIHYDAEFTAKYYNELDTTKIDSEEENELINVRDYRFSACLLNELLQIFSDAGIITLKEAVAFIKTVLKKKYKYNKSKNYSQLLHSGALGSKLHNELKIMPIVFDIDKTTDEILLKIAKVFMEELYPVTLHQMKSGHVQLHYIRKNKDLMLRFFGCRLQYAEDFDVEVDQFNMPFFKNLQGYIDPHKEQKEKARELRKEGLPYEQIAKETNLSYGVVRRESKNTNPRHGDWEERIRLQRELGIPVEQIANEYNLTPKKVYALCNAVPSKKAQRKKAIVNLVSSNEEEVWKTKEIHDRIGGPRNTFNKTLKELVNDDQIKFVKKGFYTRIVSDDIDKPDQPQDNVDTSHVSVLPELSLKAN